jgi:hypothetical protein
MVPVLFMPRRDGGGAGRCRSEELEDFDEAADGEPGLLHFLRELQ